MENVIVTIKSRDGGRYYDMQLPANMPAKALSGKILSLLRNYDPEFVRQVHGHSVNVLSIGRHLDDDETLEEAGIWDGDIITLF